MGIGTLFSGNFDEYFKESRDTPSTLWFFLHIPKTAGSSFRAELADRLRPQANVHVDHAKTDLPRNERMQAAIDAFVAEATVAPVPFRFASGHLKYSEVLDVLRAMRAVQRRMRVITMLRDPVARVISDFRYMRTPAHPTYQAVIAKFPTLESYIEHRSAQNKMMRFLRRRGKDSTADVIKDMEQMYSFVGLTERYDLSARTLFKVLAFKEAPEVYTRKTESREENRIDNLEQMLPRIRELNAQDIEIYDHFAAKWS
jgi:hypothetical protein